MLKSLVAGFFVATVVVAGLSSQSTSPSPLEGVWLAMNPKAFVTYSYKLEGNTVSITGIANQNGAIKDSPTVKFTRIE